MKWEVGSVKYVIVGAGLTNKRFCQTDNLDKPARTKDEVGSGKWEVGSGKSEV